MFQGPQLQNTLAIKKQGFSADAKPKTLQSPNFKGSFLQNDKTMRDTYLRTVTENDETEELRQSLKKVKQKRASSNKPSFFRLFCGTSKKTNKDDVNEFRPIVQSRQKKTLANPNAISDFMSEGNRNLRNQDAISDMQS